MSSPSPGQFHPVDPPSPRINVMTLVAADAGTITNVNLYSGCAEITRCFKLVLAESQNQITIRRFPHTLQQDSVRVEVRGHASIHDVYVSQLPSDAYDPPSKTSHHARKITELENQITCLKHSRHALDTYLGTVNTRDVHTTRLEEFFSNHSVLARKLDNEILDLEQELFHINERVPTNSMDETNYPARLPWQIMINIAPTSNEEVDILVKYVVSDAEWHTSYDIRVDTETMEHNIVILSKASIKQNTGESWEGVALTLHTSKPTFGTTAPSLRPWTISGSLTEPYPWTPIEAADASIWRSTSQGRTGPPLKPIPREHATDRWPTMNQGWTGPPPMPMASYTNHDPNVTSIPPKKKKESYVISPKLTEDCTSSTCSNTTPPSIVQNTTSAVALTGMDDVPKTFRVPGYIDVPADGQQHNVTISSFKCEALLSWSTIPKVDARVHLEAKIKNDSHHTFIPGRANVYVDGSFVGTTSIPAVKPDETFNCSLGSDSSLEVTYHPRKKTIRTIAGFLAKSTVQTITQHISVFNTKTTLIKNLKVVDNIPVSWDQRIDVKLINPSFDTPWTKMPPKTNLMSGMRSNAGNRCFGSKNQDAMHELVFSGRPHVLGQWVGYGNSHADQGVLGKHGRVSWAVPSVGPQETLNLVLKFKVTFPEGLLSIDGV